jgi:integrase
MGRPKKNWSVRVGARGYSVIVYERTSGGPLWLRWWVPASSSEKGAWHYRALQHADRIAAETTAREIAGQLLASTVAAASGKATVSEVFATYDRDRAKFAKGQGYKEAKRRMAIWTSFLGANRNVATIDFPTLDRYVRARRAGEIHVAPYELKKNPTDRAIGADFTLLQAALNHATLVVRPNGSRLLITNPVRGYEAPRNKNPRRPVATYDRFLAVQAKADSVDPQQLFRAFMELVEALGWRVTAICELRASDVDRKSAPMTPLGRIHKRAETDKEGESAWVPMSQSVRSAVDRVLEVNPGIGEWPLFPAPKAKVDLPAGAIPKPWSRHHASKLLRRAEKAAGLDPLEGSDFHAYRRKWATERKHLPTKDVAAAGQWRDQRTLETAYMQSDEETILAVVNEPRKLRAARQADDSASVLQN